MTPGEVFAVTSGTTMMPVLSVYSWDILHMVFYMYSDLESKLITSTVTRLPSSSSRSILVFAAWNCFPLPLLNW